MAGTWQTVLSQRLSQRRAKPEGWGNAPACYPHEEAHPDDALELSEPQREALGK